MKIGASVALSGGQGKTSTAVVVSKLLARLGKKVLLVDCDPQASATALLDVGVAEDYPTTFELFKGGLNGPYEAARWKTDFFECVYETEEDNLFVVPADNSLDSIQEFLAESGMGMMMLRQRLRPAEQEFDFCIVDSPPQRSQITRSCIASADFVVLPAETKEKGYISTDRTLAAISQIKDLKDGMGLPSSPTVLGILPFRLRMVGLNIPRNQREALTALGDFGYPVLSAIVDSAVWEKALSQNKLPMDLPGTNPDLQLGMEELVEKIMAGLKDGEF